MAKKKKKKKEEAFCWVTGLNWFWFALNHEIFSIVSLQGEEENQLLTL